MSIQREFGLSLRRCDMSYPNNGPVRSCKQAGWDADAEHAMERRKCLNGREAAREAEEWNAKAEALRTIATEPEPLFDTSNPIRTYKGYAK